jgi:Domain of unknown function (DUF1995)
MEFPRRVAESVHSVEMAFIPLLCSLGSAPGVPHDARSAVRRLRGATQAALALGKRGLLVDVLVESMRRDARTFDAAVHALVIEGIVRSLAVALRDDAPSIRLLVPGTRAALHLTDHFAGVAAREQERAVRAHPRSPDQGLAEDGGFFVALPPVEIDMLGTGRFRDTNGALLVLQPPGVGSATNELVSVVQSALKRSRPVVVVNCPQEGSVHKITGYPGQLPPELTPFEPVFLLAPFAIHAQPGTTSAAARKLAGRFVLLRVFPSGWQLWRQQERVGRTSTPNSFPAEPKGLASVSAGTHFRESNRQKGYDLCEEWNERPDEQALFDAVTRATSKYSRFSTRDQ